MKSEPAVNLMEMDKLPQVSRSELLTNKVTDALRAAILNGSIKPGSSLSVPEISRRLGVSRTPAREALLVLEREGLVNANGRSGMTVFGGDERDRAEALELREALEGMVGRLAATRITESGIESLKVLLSEHKQALEANDIDRHVEIDSAFHTLLREACGNSRLEQTLRQVEHQIRLINLNLSHHLSYLSIFDPRATIKDHRAIIEAIESRDGEMAELAMRNHVRRVRELIRTSKA